jgi:hypothetical protein
MYGLKEVGKLSNLRLVSLLFSSFGFHETSTPCLFKHVSRPILFVLVVDDFGVRYKVSPTLSTMARLERLLGYVAAHPDGRKIFRASDMLLRVPSDASFLSRPNAGSVAGGLS